MAAANRYMLLRALVLAAKKQAVNPATPTSILEGIVVGKFTSEITSGKTLISSTEGGGVVTFALMSDLTPSDIVALAMEALSWLQDQPDPANPSLYPRRIKRLRASFIRATI